MPPASSMRHRSHFEFLSLSTLKNTEGNPLSQYPRLPAAAFLARLPHSLPCDPPASHSFIFPVPSSVSRPPSGATVPGAGSLAAPPDQSFSLLKAGLASPPCSSAPHRTGAVVESVKGIPSKTLGFPHMKVDANWILFSSKDFTAAECFHTF